MSDGSGAGFFSNAFGFLPWTWGDDLIDAIDLWLAPGGALPPPSLGPEPGPEGSLAQLDVSSCSMSKSPSTPATRLLREKGVAYTEHPYRYEEKGGTRVSARELGVDEHAVIKTLVMEDEDRQPLIVLMHGDREVSTKALARLLGKKAVQPCKPEVANRHSGYLVGGTSPFGTRKAMPVFIERTILDLERIYLNGGSRGFLVGIAPAEVVRDPLAYAGRGRDRGLSLGRSRSLDAHHAPAPRGKRRAPCSPPATSPGRRRAAAHGSQVVELPSPRAHGKRP